MNREEYALEDPCTRNETHNTENQNITEPSTTISMLTQEEKNFKLIQNILSEKNAILLFVRNQDRKRVKVETEKVNY